MRKLTVTLAAAACALIVNACQDATEPVAVEGSGGSGNDTRCVSFLTGAHDNVIVPPGATCTIGNAVVRGNVKALENSRLFTSSTSVGGNVEGDKAEVVQLVFGTRVAGNVIIKDGEFADNLFDVAICGTTVEGNVEIAKMTGAIVMGGPAFCANNFRGNLKIEENLILVLDINLVSVGQNMQVFKNRGAGTKLIFSNTVGQDLQCFENQPPFVGGPNAARKAEGQCF